MTPVFTLDGIRKFHAWTHASLTLLLGHLATLSGDDYSRELSGFGYPSIHAQVIHLLGCEPRWINRLEGHPVVWDPARWPTLADALALQGEARAQTLAYLAGLTEQDLNTPVEIRFSETDILVRTPALILHHVFTHAFHHKGQIVAMCRILGHPAPLTDLFQFE